MNIPLSFSDATTELSTLTSQTGNFTFNSTELQQALTFAWQDAYVTKPAWDTSLTYSTSTWLYSIPSTVTALQGVYYQPDTNFGPEPLSSDVWEIINGQIHVRNDVGRWLDAGDVIYLKGRYKLTTSDSLPTMELANYVLYLAAERLLNQLLLKKTFVFLTNDTTVGEIVAALRQYQTNVLTYKQALLREYEEA